MSGKMKKLQYSYRFVEYDHEAIEKALFMRNNLLADLICKTITQERKSRSNNLQPGGSSLKADLQAAGCSKK